MNDDSPKPSLPESARPVLKKNQIDFSGNRPPNPARNENPLKTEEHENPDDVRSFRIPDDEEMF